MRRVRAYDAHPAKAAHSSPHSWLTHIASDGGPAKNYLVTVPERESTPRLRPQAGGQLEACGDYRAHINYYVVPCRCHLKKS